MLRYYPWMIVLENLGSDIYNCSNSPADYGILTQRKYSPQYEDGYKTGGNPKTMIVRILSIALLFAALACAGTMTPASRLLVEVEASRRLTSDT